MVSRSLKARLLLPFMKKQRAEADLHSYGMRIAPGFGKVKSGAWPGKLMDTQTKKGILFDSTRCIGCGACYQACKEKNHLPRTPGHFLRDNLSAKTYTVVKLRSGRFVRQMCMHCEQPACASVCPVAALP